MDERVKERSAILYFFLTFLTCGIYALVFWSKYAKDVNRLCEGDGKRTMKYFPAWLLSVITFGIFDLVWKFKLAKRLKENAPRYDLNFAEGGGIMVVLYTVGKVMLLCGPLISQYLFIRNFNQMAKAYNDYNGLEDPDADKRSTLFMDEPEEAAE